ncbi:hypothetical protein HRG84_24385 [Flavisolibacter sp. BT320]|nr:hypothetical protein [Flavisolibacter longurius]
MQFFLAARYILLAGYVIIFGCLILFLFNSSDEGKLLQSYLGQNEIVRTYLVDQGAFGRNVTLAIFDKDDNRLLEEIGLRGEDYLPTIDSIVGTNIYIHYSFPVEDKTLDFKAVALGEALLSPEKLKYKYIVWNKKT